MSLSLASRSSSVRRATSAQYVIAGHRGVRLGISYPELVQMIIDEALKNPAPRAGGNS